MARLLGIAAAPAKRAGLIELDAAEITLAKGIAGDARGARSGRQVTVLFWEGWEKACCDIHVVLPWITRRANLLIEGMAVPPEGGRLILCDVVLEVTQETKPCQVMEAAHRGLRRALAPGWRGGVCCRVIAGGAIRVGNTVDAA